MPIAAKGREHEVVPCAGHRHVEEPPLVVDAALVARRGDHLARQEPRPLLAREADGEALRGEGGHEDDGPLQALRAVHRGDGDGVEVGVVLAGEVVVGAARVEVYVLHEAFEKVLSAREPAGDGALALRVAVDAGATGDGLVVGEQLGEAPEAPHAPRGLGVVEVPRGHVEAVEDAVVGPDEVGLSKLGQGLAEHVEQRFEEHHALGRKAKHLGHPREDLLQVDGALVTLARVIERVAAREPREDVVERLGVGLEEEPRATLAAVGDLARIELIEERLRRPHSAHENGRVAPRKTVAVQSFERVGDDRRLALLGVGGEVLHGLGVGVARCADGLREAIGDGLGEARGGLDDGGS